MGYLLNNVKQYLATHTKEEFRQAWEKIETLDLEGPTVWEVIRMQQGSYVYRQASVGIRYHASPCLKAPYHSDQPTLNLAA